MAIIEGGVSAALAGVGAESYVGLHSRIVPLSYGVLGHYRVAFRFQIIAAQAANSRLFEVRNTATNLIVPTRLNIRWLQTAAHTAAIEDSLDCVKVTGFTVVDTTNTVTPVPSIKRAGMAASPGGAALRHVTVAGAGAGMTGGTLTEDTAAFSQLPRWLLLAQPTAGIVTESFLDALDDVNGTHPWVFGQNEGFIVKNRVLLGAAAGSSVYIDFSYAEIPAF